MADAVEVDVAVIGLGPGGEYVAAELARSGLSVVGVDRRLVGGECPYYGCIPSKMMIRAADALQEARRVPALGGATTVEPTWSTVARRIRDEATDNWDDAAAVHRLERSGAHFVRGHGRLGGPGLVTVTTADGEQRFAVRRGVVLNTGTEPAVPPIKGLAETPYWTNRDAVALTELPSRLIVLGGGAIGCEMAQAFARFGVEVTIVEGADRILGPEEPEASEVVAGALADEGIEIRTGRPVTAVSYDDGFTVGFDDGSSVGGSALLVATGRRTNVGDVGLETVGGDPEARAVDVDEQMRVAGVDAPVWAIGDITGKGAFTHMSMYQAAVAVRSITGEDGPWADFRAVSHVTFTDPEVGSVGMTEQQARDAGIRVGVGTTDLAASSRGFIHKVGNHGLIKVVADLDRDVLVGATAVGPSGGEVIGMLVTAVHAELPLSTLRTMHFAYPTFHRAIETALTDIDEPR